ncbi:MULTISPECIES: hybrid sensor histidine kinase/response regulator AtsR [Burkholderia]|uniref:hybrid sensor histidine kinase/response regulator AtsR n=1 Tax=Burkholderia TaxID=32008 RepID=UPI0007528F10|nr:MULTISPECIES: hybrid sensor histidine kinase/response regulator AtsR [Burkholderia]AOJ69876.1 hybrid sensor histidine kinase/response regulator [Burkholderia savannae]KVG41287.1 hybrid sensor histidine kinase/response regulator [Burkholderia sp. MSMB0265]KVG84452.1 hybrid sensor histidine kinase/response regulator [Burkholderia sp. MSMB2040]KVG95587.1 hybrid sensor histidine kinase/response regulator [Burkholderia sp. MSMB2041]KVH01257.1 hybrid sensor histidine kinase/response regulator [Bu
MSKVRWRNEKIIVALGSLWILGFAAWAFLLYDLLGTSVKEGILEGPREGVFWTAAQYRNSFSRFDRQLILYAARQDRDFDGVLLQLDSLEASFGFLQRPSEVSAYWLSIPKARDDIDELARFMTSLRRDVPALRDRPDDAKRVLRDLAGHWPKVNALANYFRSIEMEQRDFTFHQLKEKRRAIVMLGGVLGVILGALFLLLFYTIRTRGSLLERQQAALDAQRQASDRAFEMIAAKNAFLGMVSHELRTPLQAICGSIEVLLARPQSEANTKTIKRLQNSAASLEAQVKELTDYIKLRSTNRSVQAETVQVAPLLTEVLDPLRARARDKHLTAALRVEPPDLVVKSDRKLIQQIVSNLIENAIKYTNSGTISISADLTGTAAKRAMRIAVRDTGVGIAKNMLQKIFEPFFRVNAPGVRHVDGIGMGLAVVRELVVALHGHVEVRSVVGEGSEFVVTLPVELPGSADVSGDAAQPSLQTPHRGLHALVVDDNENARETLGAMLTALGIQVDLRGTGKEGLRCFGERQHDIVVLDLELPDLSGFEVAEQIRWATSAGTQKKTSILGVSAYESALLKGDRAIFDEFVPKPVHLDALSRIVRRLRN